MVPVTHDARAVRGQTKSWSSSVRPRRMSWRFQKRLQAAQIVGEQLLDDFFDTFATRFCGDHIGALFQSRQGIGYGDNCIRRWRGTHDHFRHHRAQRVVGRKSKFFESRAHAGTFIYSRGKNHYRFFIEDDLEAPGPGSE